jgi:aldehyde dehydrogenase (NAD+)
MKPTSKIFIDGQWITPASNASINVITPSDGTVIGAIARGNAEDIDAAVRAAHSKVYGPL